MASTISAGTTTTTALVYTADTSGILQLQTNGTTTAVTIDTAQNVGIGVTPSAWGSGYKAIDISGSGSFYGTSVTSAQVWNAYNNGTNWIYKTTNSSALYTVGAGTHTWYNAGGGTAGNAITFTQTMTLNNSGALSVTTNAVTSAITAQSGVSGDVSQQMLQIIKYDNNTTTSQVFVKFVINNGGSFSGQINANGANQAAFGSTSEITLKTNITPLAPQLANINALELIEFDYIESEGGGHNVGFSAQNMQEIYPDTVGTREDGKLTLTGWNKTEARLVKAIQELSAKVTALEAKVG
jgi:hypothetical protein